MPMGQRLKNTIGLNSPITVILIPPSDTKIEKYWKIFNSYLVGKRIEGNPPSPISIKNKDVYKLIEILNKNGIEIDQKNSEKSLKYTLTGTQKISTIPLNNPVGEGLELLSYSLRGGQVELLLEDYCNSEYTSPLNPATGRMLGDTKEVMEGVYCVLKFNGPWKKGKKTVETLDKILPEFYRTAKANA